VTAAGWVVDLQNEHTVSPRIGDQLLAGCAGPRTALDHLDDDQSTSQTRAVHEECYYDLATRYWDARLGNRSATAELGLPARPFVDSTCAAADQYLRIASGPGRGRRP